MKTDKFKEEMEFRRDVEKTNKTMYCPLSGENCKTVKCMFYDDESQQCAIITIAKGIVDYET